MRHITRGFIHCAATKREMDIGAEEIRKWHVDERGWSDIGYHYVIRRNGDVERGRQDEVQGAHAKGHNFDSLGICLVGGMGPNGEAEFNFTQAQMTSLNALANLLVEKYPGITFHGHNEVDSAKECPGFSIECYFEELNHVQIFRGKPTVP